ncbi:alpha/beta fold hydrolase [Pseudoglutamicibacter cumminsii]|uniref:alpha/beta fold hydrolase n=1 Tax=Pseudoglutamicibacter cumminsii TaxID=156979 RepID=UPI0026F298E6|nr:alpha/beta fold hydrolase [Pseudoglutamicibacter cumminsii]
MADSVVLDANLPVQVVGEGSVPLVFLHGLMGRGRNFVSVARALSSVATSYLVDLPNHGAAAWTDEFSYDQMADSVVATMKARGVDSAVVVGHSMGGKVAMKVALRHGDFVRALAVIDISPRPADYEAQDAPFKHLLDSVLSLDLNGLESRKDADAALASEVEDQGVRAFLLQNLQREGDGWSWQPNVAGLRSWLAKIGDFPRSADDAPYAGSVVWVGGGESDYISDEDVPVMKELFPAVRKIMVKGAGHWVHADRPEVVIQIVSRVVGNA